MSFCVVRIIVPYFLILAGKCNYLHSSSVVVGDGACAFLANSMGGKSTLANYFVQRGHDLVTDESLGLLREGTALAVPSVPFSRPYRQAECLGDPVERFASRPQMLRAIYLLEFGEGPARIVPISGAEAAASVAKHCQFRVRSRAAERFAHLAAVADSTRVARLIRPKDLSQLGSVYDAVLADCSRLN